MTGIKISELPAADTLDGSELVPLVQAGVTVRSTGSALSIFSNPSVLDLAALKALLIRPEVVAVETGQAAGLWQWALASTTTANDGTVVTPTSGMAGRYKRIYDGPLYATWFGAVGDWNDTSGTDNGTAINAALQYATSIGGSDVVLPVAPTGTTTVTTGYYTTQTITIPERCRLIGLGSQSTISSSVRIIGALSLSPIVLCDGGTGSRATGLINMAVTRETGTVPDTSVGVLIQRSHYAHLERVLSMRSAFAYHVDNVATGTLLRECFSTIIHKSHVLWTLGPMLELDACSFGLSGLDVACESYIRIDLSGSGGVGADTLRVIGTQFNETPVGVDCLLDFRSYADSNGTLKFIGCHIEGLAAGTSNVIRSDAASTVIRFLSFESCSINRSTATPEWFACNAATTIRNFSFQNSSTSINMNLPPNATSLFQVGDSILIGTLSCSGALVLQLSGNDLLGAVTMSGTIPSYYADGNHFGSTYTDTSTSTKIGFFNSKIGQETAGSLTAVNFRSGLPITGGVTAYHNLIEPLVHADVTTQANGYATAVSVANSAFTLPTLRHYSATQATFGGAATVTTQQGFYVHSTIADATNNYGFYSDVPAATNNYSFYGNSTAKSQLNGLLLTLGGTAVGAGANTQAFIKASSTADLGLYYGTGDPSFSAAKGSLYTKTNATTAVTRLWVNTDGSTTWAFFTASA